MADLAIFKRWLVQEDSTSRSTGGWTSLLLTIVLLLIGGVLVIAAFLKAVELRGDFALRGTVDWKLVGWIVYEAALGFALCFGVFPRLTRTVALTTFALLLGLALSKAVSGESDCGCFGVVSINPWIVVAFDMFALLSLATATSERNAGQQQPWILKGYVASVCIAITTLFAIVILQQRAELLADGRIEGTGFVRLEPRKWIGHKLPIANHTTIQGLDQGDWTVVLYLPNCDACHRAIAARIDEGVGSDERVALVALHTTGYDAARYEGTGRIRTGILDQRVLWVCHVPTWIMVRDGEVIALVKTEEATIDLMGTMVSNHKT